MVAVESMLSTSFLGRPSLHSAGAGNNFRADNRSDEDIGQRLHGGGRIGGQAHRLGADAAWIAHPAESVLNYSDE
jgi:hypothetical protein